MIKILSAKADGRAAQRSLYREVPFSDLLKPVLEKKRKFLALEQAASAALWGRRHGIALPADFSFALRVVGMDREDGAKVHTPELEGTVPPRPGLREARRWNAGLTCAIFRLAVPCTTSGSTGKYEIRGVAGEPPVERK